MNAQQETAHSTLLELIETCRDGQEGFRKASECIANHPELKLLLASFSVQRGKFARELEEHLRALGGEVPESGGSVSGQLHRWWMDLEHAATREDNHRILAECERGEDTAREVYRKALSDLESLPDSVRGLALWQEREIVGVHDTVKALRDASPETFDAIHAFVKEVLRPYGPAIVKTERPTAPVGLLASAAGAWFTDKELGYNVNEAALPYASLLVMNDVPFDLLLDNDIQEGGLGNYKALVIAYGSTLTKKMADEIVAFAKRGGTVISNEPLPLKIPNLVVTNFDFEPLLRQDGRPRKDGKPMVTADEAREMMERYAAALAPQVKAFRGPVTSLSKRVIINSLDAHGARYDFVINDDRTYGPRFGEYRLHFEQGVPQKAEVKFDGSTYPVLYDLLARKPLADLRSNGGKPLTLELPPAAGRIILALPEAVERVEVQGPVELERGKPVCLRAQVIGAGGTVMKHAHPLQVRILDGKGEETGWSCYTAAFDGVAEITFTPAWNDAAGEWTIEVTDLAVGKTGHIHPKLN